MEDRCSKHLPSHGFIDGEGVWHCWKCYKEDKYLNPIGEVIMTRTYKNIEARVLATAAHRITVEVWIKRGKKYLLKAEEQFDYLSQASQHWDRLLCDLEKKQAEANGGE